MLMNIMIFVRGLMFIFQPWLTHMVSKYFGLK